MELKEGMYVRTDTGVIEKLEGIHQQNKTNDTIIKLNKMGGGRYAHILDINSEFAEKFDKDFSRGNIIKASFNIIDLIEVGDYVNGCKIIELATNIDGKVLYLETDITEFDNVYACGHINIYKNDIKSIVTKEQFRAMEYEVK